MNEAGAEQALDEVVAGNDAKLRELCEWLLETHEQARRYLPPELEGAIKSIAATAHGKCISAMLEWLDQQPDSTLIAGFSSTRCTSLVELPSVSLGPASEVARIAPSEITPRAWPEDSTALTIMIRQRCLGRLGAVRATTWLQTLLGALTLVEYSQSGAIFPLSSPPALGTAVFLASPTREPTPVDQTTLAPSDHLQQRDLSDLLSTDACRELLLDALAQDSADIVQLRLTAAARWLQLATSAAGTSDALVALGTAFETITGDSSRNNVVDKTTRRAAIFLSASAPRDERADLYYDELKRAKRLYKLRSIASHGQYDELRSDQAQGEQDRAEFHRFVLDVILGFRDHARERNIKTDADFETWWRRSELEGLFS